MAHQRWLASLGLVTLAFLTIMSACTHRSREPHSVTLTWQAPAPREGVTIVGFNVYRRSADGGAFVKVANLVSGLRYEDRQVTSGRTYQYAVTAVDQAERESRFSTEVTVRIP